MVQRFVAINVTPEARERLRALSFRLTGTAGRRVSFSDALLAVADLADRYPDDLTGLVTSRGGAAREGVDQ